MTIRRDAVAVFIQRDGKGLAMTTNQESELLKTNYTASNADELISILEQFFKLYADRSKWNNTLIDNRYPQRVGMNLDFWPRNCVDGYVFANEAIGHIERFRTKSTFEKSSYRSSPAFQRREFP